MDRRGEVGGAFVVVVLVAMIPSDDGNGDDGNGDDGLLCFLLIMPFLPNPNNDLKLLTCIEKHAFSVVVLVEMIPSDDAGNVLMMCNY